MGNGNEGEGQMEKALILIHFGKKKSNIGKIAKFLTKEDFDFIGNLFW